MAAAYLQRPRTAVALERVSRSDLCQLCHRHIAAPIQLHPWLSLPRAAAPGWQLKAAAAEDVLETTSAHPSTTDSTFDASTQKQTAQAVLQQQRPFDQPDLDSIQWLKRQHRRKKKKVKGLQKDITALQKSADTAQAKGQIAKAQVLRQAVKQKALNQQQLKKGSNISTSQVAMGVEALCEALEVPLDQGLRIAERCDRLLLKNPTKVRQRLEFLAAAMGATYQDALQLAIIRPSLLLYSLNTIQRNLALLTQHLNLAKGSPLLEVLTQRPELLTTNPASVTARVSGLASLLSVSENRARSVVVACPRLLRSSAPALQSKFNRLKKMLAIPASTLAELLLREPRLLVMGSPTMKRKFQALLFKFAMFEDEVVDMLLADPSVLMSDDLTSYEMAAMMASTPGSPSSESYIDSSPLSGSYTPPSSSGLPSLTLPSPSVKPSHRRSTLVDPITLLCRVLGVPAEKGVLLLGAHGAILGERTPGRLRGEVTQLAAMLGVAYEDAAAMVCSQPGLLAWSAAQQPAPLAPVVSDPQTAALPDKMEDVSSEGELQQTLTQLEDLLAVDESSLRALFKQVPDLLTEPRSVIASRLKRLQEALGVSSSRAAQVAIRAPQLLQDPNSYGAAGNMKVLQDVLGISKSQVSELVCREPELLVVPPSEIQQRFQALAARFGLFQDDAIDVVMADPSILLRLTDEQFDF